MTLFTSTLTNRGKKSASQTGKKNQTARKRWEATRPGIEHLEDRTLLTGPSIAQAFGGLQNELDSALVHPLGNSLSRVSIPFIGDQLASAIDQGYANGLMNAIGSQLQQQLNNPGQSVQDAVYNALNGLGLVTDPSQVSVPPPSGSVYTISAHLHTNTAAAKINVAFNTGLQGLPLNVQVGASGSSPNITLNVGFDYELALQYNASDGSVTLNAGQHLGNSPHQMALGFNVLLPPGFNATIQLGILFGSATPLYVNPNDNTFSGTVYVDGLDGVGGDVVPGIDGSANINFALALRIGANDPNLPSVNTNFTIAWNFNSAQPALDVPTIGFGSVSFGLGQFVSQFIQPVLRNVEQVIGPLDPVIKVLKTPIPGLNELSQFLGQGPFYFRTLIDTAAEALGLKEVTDIIDTTEDVIHFIDQFKTDASPDGEITVPLDGFTLDGSTTENGGSLTPTFPTTALDDLINSVPANVRTDLKNILNPTTAPVVSYEILDHPDEVIARMLLGQNSGNDLFAVDANPPPNTTFNSSQASGFSLFGIGINYTGTLTLNGHIHLGYDTTGINDLLQTAIHNPQNVGGEFVGDILKGFYLSKDSTLSLSGFIGADATASVGFASVGAEGGIYTGQVADGVTFGSGTYTPITITVNPGPDGTLRLADISSSSFTVGGQINAGLNVIGRVGVTDFTGHFWGYQKNLFNIASVTLVDFTNGWQYTPPQPPVLATAPGGVLTLAVGNGYEDFTIAHTGGSQGSESLVVESGGYSNYFDGIASIKATGDSGNLSVLVEPGVLDDANLIGGDGPADLTYIGSGTAHLTAGAVASVLKGGSGTNYLYGRNGGDVLYGGGQGSNNYYLPLGGTDSPESNREHIVAQISAATNEVETSTDTHGDVLEVVGTVTNATSISIDPNGNTFKVPLRDGTGLTIHEVTCLDPGVDELLLPRAVGVNQITIGDLSQTGLQDVQMTTLPASPTDPPATVTITGPAQSATLSVAVDSFHDTNLNIDKLETKFGVAIGDRSTANTRFIHIFGLSAGDNVELDGNGGADTYNVFPDARIPLNVSIHELGGGNGSTIVINDDNNPINSIATPDISVNGAGVVFGYQYRNVNEIPFRSYVNRISYDGPITTVSITDLVQNVDTGIAMVEVAGDPSTGGLGAAEMDISTGGGAKNTFTVSGLLQGKLVLDSNGAAQAEFDINGNFGGESITVQDSGHSVSDGLGGSYNSPVGDVNNVNLNDGNTRSDQGSTTYTIDNNTITRAALIYPYPSAGGFPVISTINYSNIANLVINGSALGNTFNVDSTAAGTITTINAGTGNDAVNVVEYIYQFVTNVLGAAPSLAGGLTVHGDGQTTSLLLDDRSVVLAVLTVTPPSLAYPGPTTYTVGQDYLKRSSATGLFAYGFTEQDSQIQIDYSNLATVTVDDYSAFAYSPNGNAPANTFQLVNTAGTNQTTLNVQSAGAQVKIGDAAHPVSNIGNVTIQGQGDTSVVLDDEATALINILGIAIPHPDGTPGLADFHVSPNQVTYVLATGSINRQGTVDFSSAYEDNGLPVPGFLNGTFSYTTNIGYSGVAGISLTSGSTITTYNVQSGSVPVTIVANADVGTSMSSGSVDGSIPGHDTVNVGDPSLGMDPVTGLIDVHGAGNTELDLSDQATNILNVRGEGVNYTKVPSPKFTVTGSEVTRQNHVVYQGSGNAYDVFTNVEYDHLGDMNIDGGQTANEYDVKETTFTLSIVAGPSTDFVKIGDPQDTLDYVRGYVNVFGNSNTTMIVDDTATKNYGYNQNFNFHLDNSISFAIDGQNITRTNQVTVTSDDPSLSGSQTAVLSITQYNVGQVEIDGASPERTFDGNPAGTTFSIDSTYLGTSTTIKTGSNQDTVNVGSASNTLDPIQGAITINGNASTTLNVNDDGNPVTENYTVSPTTIQRSIDVAGVYDYNIATITYYTVGHVNVYVGTAQRQNQGAGINTLDVVGTLAGTATDLYGNSAGGQTQFAATPYVDATSGYNANDQILGAVHFHGSSIGLDTVGYYDYFDRAPQSYNMTTYMTANMTVGQIVDAGTISNGQIVPTGFAPVTYDGRFYGAGLTTSAVGGSAVSLSSTAATVGAATVVEANAGDTVTVGSQAPALGGTLSQLGTLNFGTVAGSNGPATFILDDSGDTQMGKQATFNTDSNGWGMSGLSLGRVYVGAGSNVQVLGGSPAASQPGGNTYDIESVPAGVSLTLGAGKGTDTVNVGSDPVNLSQSILDPIRGAVTVNGTGNTTLNFNDQGGNPGAAAGHVYNYYLAQNSFYRVDQALAGTATVTFNGIATVNLNAANAGGSGFNVLGVSSTAPGTTYNVYAGTGENLFEIFDINYTLNGIQGPLNLHGTGGFIPNDDAVFLNDIDKTTRHTFFVNAGATPQSGMVQRYNAAATQTDAALISYDGLNAYSVLYTAGSGSTINVQSQASDLWTVLAVGTGDTVNIGNASHTLNAFQGDLRIQGALGQTPTVHVDDAADSNSQPITMASDGSNGYLVNGLLPSSSGRGRIWFELDPAAPVSIKSGARAYHVHDLGAAPAFSLDAVGGTLDTGAGGLTGNFDHTLSLADFSAVSMHVLGDWSGSLLAPNEGTAANPISSIAIDGAMTATGLVKVGFLSNFSTGGDMAGTLKGFGSDPNVMTIQNITVGGNFVQPGLIQAPSFVKPHFKQNFGGVLTETTPVDFQELDIDGSMLATGVITAASGGVLKVGGDLLGTVNINGPLNSLNVNGNLAGQANIAQTLGAVSVGGNLSGSVAATTITSVTVGQNLTGQVTASQSLGSVSAGGAITGSVTAPSIQQATVNGTPGNDTFMITPSSVILNGSTVLAGQFASLVINGQGGNDLFQISGGTVPASIVGGAGNDTFQFATGAGITGTIDGGGGINTLVGPNSINTWTISGSNSGKLGSIGFSNIQNLVGGSCVDLFRFKTGGSLSGTLDGGPGINVLDYSAYKGDVTVDLLLHLASQVNQMAPNSVFNVANVIGSQGNDLLVGDANADVLIGGTGRNMIIGGAGSDVIFGGLGDNLLIGGTTVYDNQLPALQALMQYWEGAGSFDSRVNALQKGVVVNGLTLALNRTTVQNDHSTDYLFSGLGRNWFITDSDDVINAGFGPGRKDRVTRI